LEAAIRQARKRILRLSIEVVEEAPGKDRMDPALTESNIPVTRADALFSDTEFTMRMEQLITQTVTSKPFIEVLLDKMMPKILEAVRGDQEETMEERRNDFDIGSLLMQSLPQIVETTTDITRDLIIEYQEEEKAEVELPTIPELEQLRAEEETNLEPEQKEEEVEQEVEQDEDEEDSEDGAENVAQPEKEEPESFVVMDNNINSPPKMKHELHPLRSLLSLFRSPRRENREPTAEQKEEEVEIPNMEELLKQLSDMGFSDREHAIKTLRFHKQYNEGIDEVIEDLLLQREEAKKEAVAREEIQN